MRLSGLSVRGSTVPRQGEPGTGTPLSQGPGCILGTAAVTPSNSVGASGMWGTPLERWLPQHVPRAHRECVRPPVMMASARPPAPCASTVCPARGTGTPSRTGGVSAKLVCHLFAPPVPRPPRPHASTSTQQSPWKPATLSGDTLFPAPRERGDLLCGGIPPSTAPFNFSQAGDRTPHVPLKTPRR